MSTHTRTLRFKRLVTGLSAAFALAGLQAHAHANTVDTVTSCADDGSAGTLRSVIAASASGDQIDLTQLSCADSTITLSQGEILVGHNVNLVGSAENKMTLAASYGRALHSISNDFPQSYLTVTNVDVSGGRIFNKNTEADGGCILATGDLTLVGSTVTDCVAGAADAFARGGAINAASVNIQGSTISNSGAYTGSSYQLAQGGAIYTGSLYCLNSTLSGNNAISSADAGYGQGGGAFVGGNAVSLSGCTINSNQAGMGGGIAQFMNSSPVSATAIKNSTISGNIATKAFGGLEVFCSKCTPTPMQIASSTVAFNSSPAGYAAGIFTSGAVVAQSSIIADNRTSSPSDNADLSATTLSGSGNLIMSTDAKTAAGAIASTSDPKLTTLADHGGPTWTHGLSVSSPALGNGNNTAGLNTDQRGNGFSRTTQGTADIGAYQRQPNDDRLFSGTFQ
jgi:hypothetical protein